MTTPNMNLNLPTVSSTTGPQWAESLNAALETVDSHDHSSGKGQRITPAGLNINTDLSFNSKAVTDVNYVELLEKTELDAVNSSLQIKDGELYFVDAASNEVRITAGGAIDVGSVGGIGGDYGTGGSTVFYTDGTLTYFFQDSASDPANISVGEIDCTDVAASGTVTGVVNTSATSTGHGIVPIGAVIALNPSLTGAYTTSSTTTADSNGWVLVEGQTINDATSPMDGVTLPDLTDARFLRGSTSSGSTGGSETFTLAETNLPAHVHSIAHTHTMAHTHSIDHDHGAVTSSEDSHYHLTFRDTSSSGTITSANYAASEFTGSGGGLVNAYDIRGDGSAPNVGRTSTYNHTHSVDLPSYSGTSGASSAASTGAASTGNSGSVGSTTAVTHIPKYLNVVYVMRIK